MVLLYLAVIGVPGFVYELSCSMFFLGGVSGSVGMIGWDLRERRWVFELIEGGAGR